MTIDSAKIWDMAESMHVCMLASWNGKQLLARPMTPNVRKDRRSIYFLDAVGSDKEKEISQYSVVNLSYQDKASNAYLAISGHAKVSNNRAIIKEIWSDLDKAFFDSAEDSRIRLITFTPDIAEVWQGPNKLVAGIKMLTAAITDMKPSMGEQKKIAI